MTAIVGWAPILAPWPDRTLRDVEPLIPSSQFAAALRYRRWQDRQARLSARLILRRILRRQGVAASLDDIALTPEERPFIAGGGDFSIAHNATLALCAWVPHGRIGIDVETSRAGLTLDDMLPWMSDAERRRIAASPAPMDEALRFWTAKEAVCKADGCGIASGVLPDCATPLVTFRGTAWRYARGAGATIRSRWRRPRTHRLPGGRSGSGWKTRCAWIHPARLATPDSIERACDLIWNNSIMSDDRMT